ncbi:C-type lectin domain family 4 member M-like [Echeneis naucrates]|uniref:C-type lectin domain family 4 member M-like n=1 Tax=Echeneis naucrates TaxID=173247 RepID=A0A665WEG9_ECHNA|nr:C-type lectin domain family 4 member M-like [Echeneis naucrates]XP_029361702.1 C-type lectin domain family 4 member M-like [Echeneis naucrates]
MSVEYDVATGTKMDIEDSKIGYKQLLAGGSNVRNSVNALRNSPYKVASVFLGLLCVALLAAVLGQSVHYGNVEQQQQNSLKAMSQEKENLQENLKTAQNEKSIAAFRHNQLKLTCDRTLTRKDQLQTNNNLLTEETNKLRLSQSQLETSNAALSKELEKLKASEKLLETNNNALSRAQDLLQKQHDLVVKRKNELQSNVDSVTREKNNLQNKLNNVTRSKEQLQLSYNDLVKDIERLQGQYNFSNSEKGKLASSHQNLTIEKEALQATCNALKKAADKVQESYASLLLEKNELENSCQNVTVEKDKLKVKIENLTVERDLLQQAAEKLNETIQAKKCPVGWHRFEYSCYFVSVSKKTWSKSREFCQNVGADLAIIKSLDEMTFITGLFKSDKELWIGLTDGVQEGKWKWVDGTPLTTAYWGKGQPNSHSGRNQDCVEVWHRVSGRGDWNDENCDTDQNWICEM